MLKDYRDWLNDELTLREGVGDQQYELGRANLASRALARLDRELETNLYVALDRAQARRVLTALEALEEQATAIAPELAALRETITAALEETGESSAL